MAKTILFIEDDLPTIEVYTTALKKEGFYLAKMLTGDQGLKRIINSMPHLCRPVLIANESCYKDIDTPRDIRF